MMEKTFYYILLIASFTGFLSCLYVYLHTKRELFIHKLMAIFELLFILIGIISVLSLAGDFYITNNQILVLIMFGSITLFVGILAIKIGIEKFFRRMQICKDKEFHRTMRKRYGPGYNS